MALFRKRWLRITVYAVGLFLTVTIAACHGLAWRWGKSTIDGYEPSTIEAQAGWRINYFAAGDPEGQRVIFVHGTPGRASDFAAFIVEPVEGLESVTIDRPGFGRTTPPGAMPRLVDQAATIEALLVQRNGRWPILVGHSLGGPIVCRVAADYPDKVGGLVIAAGSLDPGLEVVYFVQRVGDFGPIAFVLPRILRNSNRELIPLKQQLTELQPLLAAIRCPIVIVHGDKDSLVPVENVDYMRAHLPAESIRDMVLLKGTDHFLPWTSESSIRDAIRRLANIES